ncbi:ABC transporter permease [Modestobacter sp. VKM Ac-2986]|uniref:ABC transporter permease n=1 Tax=Modestobacter sp. VKM Ac-2986 TaxID=3004140 RepID=UPI0022AB7B39|nr:ABC transporter permease [Modestobacter sp. VKM Ac-2986]MCZ2830982.1 ABC transporter permease [Modestobacter sp. VKM Ac-2986]
MSNGLARASIRFRPTAFAGAFVALLFASVVVAASALFLQSGVTLSAQPVRYADAAVVVAADDQVRRGEGDWETTLPLAQRPLVDAALADRLADVPGVAAVVPDVSATVTAGTATWSAAGWSRTALEPGATTVADAGPRTGQVVLAPAAAAAAVVGVGDRLELRTPGGTRSVTVAALRDAAGGPDVWVADADAAAVAGHPGRVDAFALRATEGTSAAQLRGAVRQALAGVPGPPTGLVVVTGDERGEVETAGFGASKETLTAIGGSLGGVLLTVALFVVVSTTSLAVEQRSRELALLRAIGATPRQLRRTVATEAALVAFLAAPLGLVPGLFLARWLLGEMTARGYLLPGLELSTGPVALLVTVLVVAGAAVAAGLLAARRPARIRPAEALREASLAGSRLGPARWVLGLTALAGSVPLAIVSATVPGELGMGLAATVVLTLLLAIGLLGPVVAGAVSRLARPVLDRFGAPGRLAAANGRTNARRLGSAITPLVMAVAFAGTMFLLQGSVDRATADQREAAVVADTVVSAGPAGLPVDLPAQVAALPGVGAAVGVLPASVATPALGELMPHTASGLTGDPALLSRALDVGVRDGDLAALRPGGDGTVALDVLLADALDARVGEPVELITPDGATIRPTVVARYDRGLGVAAALLPAETLRPHLTTPVLSELLVRHDGPVQPADLAALGTVTGPAAQVAGPGPDGAPASALTSDSWLDVVFAAGLAGFAAIAAANTLVMITLARRREVGLLGMVGATRRQVLRTARLEALVVAGAAIGLGSLIAWGTLLPSVHGATGAGPYVPPALAAGVLGGVVVLALVCTGVPTRVVLHGARAGAVGTRE